MAENKIKETANAVVNKADELYNKLPLDKINEKLGGKVDVKSKKFKTIAGCVVGALLVLILCLIFCGGDPELLPADIEKVEKRLKLDKGSVSDIEYIGEKPSAFGFPYDEYHATAKRDGKVVLIAIQVARDNTSSMVEANIRRK